MWIFVNLALRRPYTFIVLAIFILIAGVLSILSTPKDIYPDINIPVISVCHLDLYGDGAGGHREPRHERFRTDADDDRR